MSCPDSVDSEGGCLLTSTGWAGSDNSPSPRKVKPALPELIFAVNPPDASLFTIAACGVGGFSTTLAPSAAATAGPGVVFPPVTNKSTAMEAAAAKEIGTARRTIFFRCRNAFWFSAMARRSFFPRPRLQPLARLRS